MPLSLLDKMLLHIRTIKTKKDMERSLNTIEEAKSAWLALVKQGKSAVNDIIVTEKQVKRKKEKDEEEKSSAAASEPAKKKGRPSTSPIGIFILGHKHGTAMDKVKHAPTIEQRLFVDKPFVMPSMEWSQAMACSGSPVNIDSTKFGNVWRGHEKACEPWYCNATIL